MTWPHPKVLSLSPRNAAASLARKLPCPLPTPPALNTIAANHFPLSLPPPPPPPPQQHHHSPPRHPRNRSSRQQTTPRQVSVANVISCALTTTSFVASQTPARHAQPRCSPTCDDTIQRKSQRASFRGSLTLRKTAAPLYSKWTTGKDDLRPHTAITTWNYLAHIRCDGGNEEL
jgi:hypothetical protein